MAERLIVVGTDGSDGGRRALDWGLRHAAATGATVEVVTTYTWDTTDWVYPGGQVDEQEYVDTEQAAQVQSALSGLSHPPSISRLVVKGNAVETLTRVAEAADLLVLGSRGRGHLTAALLGSVSEACIRRGTTPVVVVPAHDRLTTVDGAQGAGHVGPGQ